MPSKPAKRRQIPCSDGRNAGGARAKLARLRVPQALTSPNSLRSPITRHAGIDSAARTVSWEDFALHHRRDFNIAHVGRDLDGENEGEGQQNYGPGLCRHACPSLSYKVVSLRERKQTEGSFFLNLLILVPFYTDSQQSALITSPVPKQTRQIPVLHHVFRYQGQASVRRRDSVSSTPPITPQSLIDDATCLTSI